MKEQHTDRIINELSKNIVWIYIVFILMLFLMPFLLTLQSPFGIINSTKTNEIGEAINGLTAPIIGSFSALLLYLAFKTQVDFNKNLLLSNETNQIKADIEQTLNDFNKLSIIYFESDKNKDGSILKYEYFGIDAINFFSTSYIACIDTNINNFNDSNYLKDNLRLFLYRGTLAFKCLNLILIRLKKLDNQSISFKRYQIARLTSIFLQEFKEIKKSNIEFGIYQKEIIGYMTERNETIMHLKDLKTI